MCAVRKPRAASSLCANYRTIARPTITRSPFVEPDCHDHFNQIAPHSDLCRASLGPLRNLDLNGIDWVIVGGESGFKSRLIDPEWATDLRDQCRKAKVPFFFKQWGGKNKKQAGRVLDGQIWDQMPGDPSRQLDDQDAQLI